MSRIDNAELATRLEAIEAAMEKGPWSVKALEAAISHVHRNTNVMEVAIAYQADGTPTGIPGRYDGKPLGELRNLLPAILSALRAQASTNLYGPYGYLIAPDGLSEEHWRLEDDKALDHGCTSIALYALEAPPSAAPQEAGR